jgi:hypothetical protein
MFPDTAVLPRPFSGRNGSLPRASNTWHMKPEPGPVVGLEFADDKDDRANENTTISVKYGMNLNHGMMSLLE